MGWLWRGLAPLRLAAPAPALALAVMVVVGAGNVSFSAFSTSTESSGNGWQASPCWGLTQTVAAHADADLQQEFPSSNFGTRTAMWARSHFATTGNPKGSLNRRALVRFSLPQVPAGCVVSSAFLRLHDGAPAIRDLDVYRLAATWSETGVTWSNQPATAGAASAAYQVRTGWVEWLVTDQVNAMYTGANNGFVVRDRAEDSSTLVENGFYTREAGSLYAPELVLRFGETACATPGPAAQVLTDYDADVRQSAPDTNSGSATSLTIRSAQTTNARVLVHFALPRVPAGCAVVAGQFRLYTSAGSSGRTLSAYRLGAPWTETGVTWNNQPTVTGSAVPAPSLTSGLNVWNLGAPFVSAWYAGVDNGLLVRDATEDASTAVSQAMHSRETSGGVPARLIVTFG